MPTRILSPLNIGKIAKYGMGCLNKTYFPFETLEISSYFAQICEKHESAKAKA